VRRFDREGTGRRNADGLEIQRRLRQEDFCQALGCDSSRKYEADGGPSIADVRILLLGYSANALEDLVSLLRLVLFNYLVGNCDAHAKNYSMMLGTRDAVRLAPAYDLTYSDTYWGEQTTSVGGKGKDISDKDFIKTGRDAGLSKSFSMDCLNEIKEKTEALSRYIGT